MPNVVGVIVVVVLSEQFLRFYSEVMYDQRIFSWARRFTLLVTRVPTAGATIRCYVGVAQTTDRLTVRTES